MTVTPLDWVGNIALLPTLHYRLAFSVLVHRCVGQLELGPLDVIAVELAPSLAAPIRAAVKRLPELTFLTSSTPGARGRRLLAVTPADALVEAVRIGDERRVPLAFVDLEARESTHAERRVLCASDFPDDSHALSKGPSRYADLIRDWLDEPTFRVEPGDSDRERAMVACLRELSAAHRRVLFVFGAGHETRIRALMQSDAPRVSEQKASPSRNRFTRTWPEPVVVARHLDEIPRLVESFERSRGAGSGARFDKREAVLDEVCRVQATIRDPSFSAGHLEAFARYLSFTLEAYQRLAPRLEDVYSAARGCFGESFARRLNAHLSSYRDDLAGEEEPPQNPQESEDELVAPPPPPAEVPPWSPFRVLFAPHSSHDDGGDSTTREPGKELAGGGGGGGGGVGDGPGGCLLHWPACSSSQRELQVKVDQIRSGLKRSSRPVTRICEFAGAIRAGVHARRTLRSMCEAWPRVWVKVPVEPRSRPRPICPAPVVWIGEAVGLSPHLQRVGGITCGESYSQIEVQKVDVIEVGPSGATEACRSENTVPVWRYEVSGHVWFPSVVEPRLLLEAVLPESQSWLREIHAVLSKNESDITSIPTRAWRALRLLDLSGAWWDLLVRIALRLSWTTVTCVTPPYLQLSEETLALASSLGKTLEHVSLAEFTEAERRSARVDYSVRAKQASGLFEYDPRYAGIMGKLWPPREWE